MVQPFVDCGCDALVAHRDKILQRQTAGMPFRRRLSSGLSQRELAGRRLFETCCGRFASHCGDRVKPLAEHRFERGLPALADVDALPDPRQRRKAVTSDPVAHFFVPLEAMLQLLDRMKPRFQRGRFGLRLLNCVIRTLELFAALGFVRL
jgi:hypothetical protein